MRNLFPVLTFALLVGVASPTLTAQAAIDAPRGVVIESGDVYASLNVWWINPSAVSLHHINLYMSTLPLENFSKTEITGAQVSPSSVGKYTIYNLSLTEDFYYYFYLTAVDINNVESAPTATYKRWAGTTKDVTSPDPSTQAAVQQPTSSSLKLTWKNPANDDFYRTAIYRSTTSPVAKISTNRIAYQVGLPTTDQSYTNTELTANTQYHYLLVGEDTKGNQSDSVSLSASTLATTVTPSTPEPTPPVTDTPPTVMPNANLFDYQAEWVSQNGVVDNQKTAHTITARPGETVNLQLTLKNIGLAWWYVSTPDAAHRIKLGTWGPGDRTTSFSTPSWLSANRAVKLNTLTTPGSTYTFSFDITIPTNTLPGTYREYFRPVAEYVEWFGPSGIFWDIKVI